MTDRQRDSEASYARRSTAASDKTRASWVFTSRSPKDTESFGRKLAGLLQPGDVLALDGDLGTGKTVLTRGIGRGLDVPGRAIRSPTYTIVHRHEEGRVPLIHVDAYRLSGPDGLLDLGIEDVLAPDAVVVVEWASRVGDLLSEACLRIRLDHTRASERRLQVDAAGVRWWLLLDHIAERVGEGPEEPNGGQGSAGDDADS